MLYSFIKIICTVLICWGNCIIIGQSLNPTNIWHDISPPLDSAARFYDLSFLDQNTGFVAGRSWNMERNLFLVLRTTNGGNSWDTTNFDPNSSIQFISFYNENLGVCGFPNIYTTNNGGQDWIKVLNVAYETLLSYGKMINEKLIYVSGTNGKIIRSTDAGSSWQYIQPDFLREYVVKLAVIDSFRMYAIADQQLIYTSDGGDTWEEVNIPLPPGVTYFYLDFINENFGFIAGSSRKVFQTTDGGISWNDRSPPPYMGEAILCIDALDSLTVVAVTNRGAILRTDDGGLNWEEQLEGEYNAILDRVQVIDKNVAYAVGYDGLLLKTTDGGTTFVNHENSTPSEYSLSQNYPNPFNSQTKINFTLMNTDHVKIDLLNSNGEKIKTLVDERKLPGEYSIILNTDKYASGVYLVDMTASKFKKTIKVVHLK